MSVNLRLLTQRLHQMAEHAGVRCFDRVRLGELRAVQCECADLDQADADRRVVEVNASAYARVDKVSI